MIVHAGSTNTEFSANHRDGNVYQLHIEHINTAKITGEFTAEEVTNIIKGLTEMVLNQIKERL